MTWKLWTWIYLAVLFFVGLNSAAAQFYVRKEKGTRFTPNAIISTIEAAISSYCVYGLATALMERF